MLEECYDLVDGISLHCYYRNDAQETGAAGDTSKFLTFNLEMENQIAEIAGVCDYVRARKRSRKKLWLSFDEWNVWYRARGGDGKRKPAPHLLEEVYNLEDALLVGGFLNSLMRRADRVRVACLAQLVNVIAPITTNPDGLLPPDDLLSLTRGRCSARAATCSISRWSRPTYDVRGIGPVPYIDAAATLDKGSGTAEPVHFESRSGKAARCGSGLARSSAAARAVFAGTDGPGSQSIEQLRESEEGGAAAIRGAEARAHEPRSRSPPAPTPSSSGPRISVTFTDSADTRTIRIVIIRGIRGY